MDPRPNRVKRKLQKGQPVLIPVSSPDPDTIEKMGALGIADALWIIDMEHGPWTWRDLSDISRACDLWGMTSVVRVQYNDPAEIGRALSLGVQTVAVPHCNTKAEAKRAVDGALYAPKGSRGMGATRHSYGVPNYFQKANDELMVVVLVEDVEAIKNLKEMLTVEDIDCFFVAPNDLSQSMGAKYMGQIYHPEVQAVVRDAVKTIVAAGRQAGTMVNPDNIEDYLKLGLRWLTFSISLEDQLRQFQTKVTAIAST